MLANGEFPNIVNFSQAVFPSGEVAGAHRHEDMTEIFLVQSGKGEIIIEGVNYPFAAGTCAVVEAGETHEIRNTGAADLIVTYFAVKTQ